jgi:hypothetical protein
LPVGPRDLVATAGDEPRCTEPGAPSVFIGCF